MTTAAPRAASALPSRSAGDPGDRVARAWASHPLVAFRRHRERIVFWRQLESVIRSGLPLPAALREMARLAPPRVARSLTRVAGDIERGKGLAEALTRHPEVFDETMVALLAAGEQAGTLQSIVGRIANGLEADQKRRWRTVLASLWPAYLAGTLVFVGPLLGLAGAIRDGAHLVALPGIYLYGLFLNLAFLLGTAALFLGFPLVVAALDQEAAWERVKLRLPGFGPLARDRYAARLLLALGAAVSAGLPVARALRLAARASGSAVVGGQVEEAVRSIEAGGTLADAVAVLGVLDRGALGALTIAERTGELDATLQRLADECDESATRRARLVMIAVLVIVVVVLLGLMLRSVLGVVFGPIWEYQHIPDQL